MLRHATKVTFDLSMPQRRSTCEPRYATNAQILGIQVTHNYKAAICNKGHIQSHPAKSKVTEPSAVWPLSYGKYA
ncbi:hypothetical protein BPAE_0109g00150 [Botrytis paeoniae]|uniref:Uncharacterized protein n=1 Tax=Botrytis paeoniae TaxID=278948 RepID=A0A4Z1FR86_9HELO|nr:hypothetical protein BPAE_0109g00150 [Botrytis paeoniae]